MALPVYCADLLQQDRLMVSDSRAVQHVLNSVDTFRMSPIIEVLVHAIEGPRGIQAVRGMDNLFQIQP